MLVHHRATPLARRRTPEGYPEMRARIGRAGLQDYGNALPSSIRRAIIRPMLDALLCAFHLHCVQPRATKPATPPAAATTACPQDFQGGRPPAIINPKVAASTYPLCLDGFATLFSGVTRTPVYSAEHLTAARIDAARGIVRVDSFHPEPRLPEGVRSELSDYRRSGYDRGHMAPNGDMGDEASQRDSFSLANMIPQDHDDNAGLWSAIEGATRNTAVADGEIYVVTGPLYQGSDLAVLQNRVYVPTGIWKAVYDPVPATAGAYVVDNKPGWSYRRVSIDELTRLTGVDPFPALPASVKAMAPDLPPPTRGRY